MLTIITNNQPRELLSFVDLSEKERADFDYIPEDEHYSPRFVRYLGNVIDVNDMMAVSYNPELKGWHAYASDSFFSGIVIRYTYDFETIVVGRYIS